MEAILLKIITGIISISLSAVITVAVLIAIQFVVYQLTGISLIHKLGQALHWIATVQY